MSTAPGATRRLRPLQVRNARAAYYPSASVTVSANQSAQGSTIRSDDFVYRQGVAGNFLGGANLNANVPIDVSGIIRRQVQQARIGEEMSNVLLRDSRDDAVAQVYIAYLTALRAQQVAEIDGRVRQSIEDLVARAHAAPAVVPFLNLELAAARQAESASRSAAEQAEDGLKQALALPLDLELDLSSPLVRPRPDPAFAVLGGTLGRRADIEAATDRVRQAELAATQAGDGRRTTVTAGAYLNQYFGGHFVSDTGRTSNRDYGLNLSLRLPLFNYDAGRLENNERIADLRAEQARADLADQRRRAELEARQARAVYDRAMRRLSALPDPEAARRALAAAETALLAASAERAPGLLAQLSNARMAWRAAQVASADAFAEATIATIRLRRAIGGM